MRTTGVAIVLVALIALVWPSGASADLIEGANGAASEATATVERAAGAVESTGASPTQTPRDSSSEQRSTLDQAAGSAASAGENVERAVAETTSGTTAAVEEKTAAAETTTRAVDETTAAAETTTRAVDETTAAAAETTRTVVETTGAAVEATTGAVEEMTGGVEEMTGGVGERTSAVVETTGAVGDQTAIVEETTAAAVETSTAVVETASAVNETAAVVDQTIPAQGEPTALVRDVSADPILLFVETTPAGSDTLTLAVQAPGREAASVTSAAISPRGGSPTPGPAAVALPIAPLTDAAPAIGAGRSSQAVALPVTRDQVAATANLADSIALLASAAAPSAAIDKAGSPAPAPPGDPRLPSELPAGSGSAQNIFSFGIFLALAALFTLWLAGWVGRLLPSAAHWRPAPYIALLERPG